MPILYVHGVAVRDATGWPKIKRYLERYIAPVIAQDPENVAISRVDWGPLGVDFAWDGASCPPTPLAGMGGGTAAQPTVAQAITLASSPGVFAGLTASLAAASSAGGLVSAGASPIPELGEAVPRLKDMTANQLSDLAVAVLEQVVTDPAEQVSASLAADEVAHHSETLTRLGSCGDRDEEAALFQQLLTVAWQGETVAPGLLPMGSIGVKLMQFKDRLVETLGRTVRLPGLVFGRAVAEFRRPLNDGVTLFLGDVFTYLNKRAWDDGIGEDTLPPGQRKRPGNIPARVLADLTTAQQNQQNRGGEPLIVLTHSMGGQIVYDLVTYFLPGLPEDQNVRIDFWCATASQVALFEEMKLFLASSSDYSKLKGNRAPCPERRQLGGWWNVWDHNDFISYTARRVFEGVDDEPYTTGYSLWGAHSGYLQRPGFFRKFARKLEAAKENNWYRPPQASLRPPGKESAAPGNGSEHRP